MGNWWKRSEEETALLTTKFHQFSSLFALEIVLSGGFLFASCWLFILLQVDVLFVVCLRNMLRKIWSKCECGYQGFYVAFGKFCCDFWWGENFIVFFFARFFMDCFWIFRMMWQLRIAFLWFQRQGPSPNILIKFFTNPSKKFWFVIHMENPCFMIFPL